MSGHGCDRAREPEAYVDRFIGRETDVRQIRRLLARKRLVVLVGIAGAGKTRLAAEVVGRLRDAYTGGVVRISPATVPGGTAAHPLEPTAAGPRLIVVDAADGRSDEYVDVACRVIGQTPGDAAIVTSRISPGAPGVQCHRVRALSLPREVDSELPANASEAVRLFVCRAQEAHSGWAPASGDWRCIAQICQQLDGLPIAIEAAARLVRTITMADLAERVVRGQNLLDLLETYARPGHSIRTGIAWSCERLREPEWVALMAFCQLDGAFTLDVADGIAQAAELPAPSGVPVLQRLSDLCLLDVDDDAGAGGPRYRVPHLVRAVVREEGTRRGLLGIAGAAVRAFFGALWTGAADSMHTAAESAEMQRVRRTDQHIPALLELGAPGNDGFLSAACANLGPYWLSNGKYQVGESWLRRALGATDASDHDRAVIHRWLAVLALRRSAYAQAEGHACESVRLARANGWSGLEGAAAEVVSTVQQHRGELPEAELTARHAHRIAVEGGDAPTVASALNRLGYLRYLVRDYDGAKELFLSALGVARRIGDGRQVARLLLNLGELAVSRRQRQAARELLDQAMAQWDRLQDPFGQAGTHEAVALMHLESADYDRCADSLRRAGRLIQLLGGSVLSDALEIAAMHSARVSRPERALRLAGAASEYRGPGGLSSFAFDGDEYLTAIDSAKTLISRDAATEAEFAGQTMDYRTALSYACDVQTAKSAGPVRRDRSALTRRQLEIAVLAADGLTNQEIALRIGIATRTVEVHLENIRERLGIRSRAQIGSWLARASAS